MATTTYNTAGSGLWLCPAGVTLITLVEVWGGASGGGKGSGSTGGNGGNGGGYASQANVAVTPGKLYPWTVGIGGQGATGIGNNNGGGPSSFSGDTFTVSATGGNPSNNPGGGTGTSGSTQFTGGSGGSPATGAGGGGGSSAGTAANGGNGGNGSGLTGGAGGTPPAGAGAGGQGQGSATPPNPFAGVAPGGAGGGSDSGAFPGAAGAAGQVRLTYTLATQPIIPFFPAGFAPLNSNFDSWIQAPLSFLTSKIVFRAELSNTLSMPNNTATVIPFNSILEDPFSGWQAGSSQWQCPAGHSGLYSVMLTVSCLPNASTPVVQARVGIDTSATVYGVGKAWVPANTVPGIAAGGIPIPLFGGQDTVQGIGFMVGGAGTVSTTAGQRCEMSIQWVSN